MRLLIRLSKAPLTLGKMTAEDEWKLGLARWIGFRLMDRTRARSNIASGLKVASVALLVFGLAFYVTVLYIA